MHLKMRAVLDNIMAHMKNNPQDIYKVLAWGVKSFPYSFKNTLLIAYQTKGIFKKIKGIEEWKLMGRTVLLGGKAIKVFAPNEDKTFSIVNVFDISQTVEDGEYQKYNYGDISILIAYVIKATFHFNIFLTKKVDKFKLQKESKEIYLPKMFDEKDRELLLIKSLIYLYLLDYSKKGWISYELSSQKALINAIAYMFCIEFGIKFDKNIIDINCINKDLEKNLELIFTLFKSILKKIHKTKEIHC